MTSPTAAEISRAVRAAVRAARAVGVAVGGIETRIEGGGVTVRILPVAQESGITTDAAYAPQAAALKSRLQARAARRA